MTTQKNDPESINAYLEIDEDVPLHKKGWKFQRGGWFFIFGLMAAAALGVFGNGLVSQKTLNDNGTTLVFERFYRHEAQMELRVYIDNHHGDTLNVSFSNSYLQDFKVESILPEPQSSRVSGSRVHYLFRGSGPMDITFHLVPSAIGVTKGSIAIGNKEYPVTHFIYP